MTTPSIDTTAAAIDAIRSHGHALTQRLAELAEAVTQAVDDGDDGQTEALALFGKLGEIAGEYLKKGRQVYIEGSIRYDKFTGADGVEKYFTDIVEGYERVVLK